MISVTLIAMSEDLRQAAARRAYGEVERLVVSFCAAAAAQARTLPPGDPQIGEIGSWLHGELECVGVMLRIGRASVAEEYRRIPFLKTYLRQRALSNR